MIFMAIFRKSGKLHQVCQIWNCNGKQTVYAIRRSSTNLGKLINSPNNRGNQIWKQPTEYLVLSKLGRCLVSENGWFSVLLARFQAATVGQLCIRIFVRAAIWRPLKYQQAPANFLCSYNRCALPHRLLEIFQARDSQSVYNFKWIQTSFLALPNRWYFGFSWDLVDVVLIANAIYSNSIINSCTARARGTNFLFWQVFFRVYSTFISFENYISYTIEFWGAFECTLVD